MNPVLESVLADLNAESEQLELHRTV